MREPLRVAICEDDSHDRDILLCALKNAHIPSVVDIYQNGEELLKNYKKNIYDLLLLDIYMHGITGVDTVGRIRTIDENIPIAFISSSTEFALESYRLSVLKYIEKPFSQKDIDDILHLAMLQKTDVPSLTLMKNGREISIAYRNIMYIEQQSHHMHIHLDNDSTAVFCDRLSLHIHELEQHNFFTAHKSYCVNLEYIVRIDRDLRCFVLTSGQNIPIRRESMGKAKTALEEYLFAKTRRFSHER